MNDTITQTPDQTYPAEHPSTQRWVYLLFLLAFLTATVFLGNSLNPFAPVKAFILHVFCLLFVFLWIDELLLPTRRTRSHTSADIPVFLFAIWSALSFLYARSLILTLNGFLHLVCGVFLFFIVSRKITEKTHAKKLLNLLLAVALATTVFSAFDFLEIDIFPWDALLENRLYSVWGGVKPDLGEALDWDFYFGGRVSSTFGNPVYVAGYLLMLLPVSFSFFLSEKRTAAKVYYAFATLALLLHLILTYTRFAWLCLPLGLLILFTIPPLDDAIKTLRKNLSWLAAGVVLSIVLALPFFYRHPIAPYYFSISERARSMLNLKDPSFLQRALIWKSGWAMAKDHLAVGVGLGNFEVFHPVYQSRFFDDEKWAAHTSWPDSAHNEYLDILCERGIPGLLLFGWFLAAVFIPVWRSRRRGKAEAPDDNPWLAAGIAGGLAALLVYGATQFPLRIIPVAVHFWILSGLLAGLHGVHRETAPTPALEKIQKNTGPAGRVILLCAFGIVLVSLATAVSAHLRANLYAYWGTRSLGGKDYRQATMLFNKAVGLYPLEQEILHYTTITWMKLALETEDPAKRKAIYENALTSLRRQFAINPNNPIILNNFGNTLLYLGVPDEAIQIYQKAVLVDPEPANAYYGMGIAYYQKRMYNFAIDAFRRCIRVEPGRMQAYYNLGKSLSDAGDIKGAEEAYLQALKLDPKNPDTLNHIGQFYDSTGRYEDAVSAYRGAVSIAPEHFSARGNLAISMINTGKFGEAVPLLTELLEEDPGSAIAHFNLGKALDSLGETRKSISHFRAAARLDPENETYRQYHTPGRKN